MTDLLLAQSIIAFSLVILSRAGLEAVWILPLAAVSFIDGKAQLMCLVLIDTAFFISMVRGRIGGTVSRGLLWQSLGTLFLLATTVLPSPPAAQLWMALAFILIRVIGGPHSPGIGINPETRFHFFGPLLLLALLDFRILPDHQLILGGVGALLAVLSAFTKAPVKGWVFLLLTIHLGLGSPGFMTPLLAASLVGTSLLSTIGSICVVVLGLSSLSLADPLLLWGAAAVVALIGVVLRVQIPLPEKADFSLKLNHASVFQTVGVLVLMGFWLSQRNLESLISNQVVFLFPAVLLAEFALRRFLRAQIGFVIQPKVGNLLERLQNRLGKAVGPVEEGKIQVVKQGKCWNLTRPKWLEPELVSVILASSIIWGLLIWLNQ